MKKLFENVEGNKFRLLTESVEDKSIMIRKGLKKVFESCGGELSYSRIQTVGLGYIKDVSEAKKIALEEARALAPTLGYFDQEHKAKFIKESTIPVVKKEVQIAESILQKLASISEVEIRRLGLDTIVESAHELLEIHGLK